MVELSIEKKNEVYLRIKAEPHVYQELSEEFTFEVPGAKFMPQYRNKYWDGKIRLFSTATGEIYVGLLDKLVSFCKRYGYEYKFIDNKFFGSLLEKEVKSIEKVMQSGEKPVLAILGGAKISSKIPIINNIIDVVDHIIIGGGMSFTFIKAIGGKIGSSICEDEMISTALEILARAKEKNVKIHLPSDVVCAKEFSNDAETKNFDIYNIPDDYEGMDAGKNSIEAFRKVVLDSKTILWNGPVGVFEFSNFSKGTKELGNLVAESTANGAFSLVGGGDSVAAVKKFGLQDKVSYVSTGGGAMLESLEGKILPGVSALSN